MQKCRLGQTDLEVSKIGLGSVKFGRNQGVKYPEAFQLPNMKVLDSLLGLSKDLGINFIDTAPAYGESEARLGALLSGQRHHWVIASKAGECFTSGQSTFNFSKPAIIESVERSLRLLKTDYIDILLVHSNGDDVAIILEDKVFETLSQLKQSGKIRSFGMSTKTIEGGLMTIEQSDLAMVTYHPEYTDEAEVIALAAKYNKGILIKKALSSGHFEKSALPNILNFVNSTPGVTSTIVGTINPKHLREIVSCLN